VTTDDRDVHKGAYAFGAVRRANEHLTSHVTPMTEPPCDAHVLATDVIVLARENEGLLAECDTWHAAAETWKGVERKMNRVEGAIRRPRRGGADDEPRRPRLRPGCASEDGLRPLCCYRVSLAAEMDGGAARVARRSNREGGRPWLTTPGAPTPRSRDRGRSGMEKQERRLADDHRHRSERPSRRRRRVRVRHEEHL